MPARSLVTILLASSFATATAHAHGGGLDVHGCHHDRQNGGYHCHQGPLAGQSYASKSEMLNALEALNQPPKEIPQPV